MQAVPGVLAVRGMLDAAILYAEETGMRVNVAIVDVAGNLAGFLRMPGSFLVSSDLAIDKAWAAASFGIPTRTLSATLEGEPRAVREGLLRRPRVTEVPGGLPIRVDGVLVGGIGVSGASHEQDERCANAGLAILQHKGPT
ncbi:hypothetical protein TZ53_23435 (plasmid) [Sphingobium sp. YBL2]|nr:hypothetical protein TZ53_23435 [Sphingobium sp. YBL2]KKC24317.1 hypothetical protein WP12_20100 [Sphingomonas sp. SRS2]